MAETKTPPATEPLQIKFPLPDGTTRPMSINEPTSEQVGVWQLSGERFTRIGAEWKRKEELLRDRADDDPDLIAFRESRAREASQGLSRALRIVGSVLADEEDRNWIEDQLLDRTIDLSDALNVLNLAIEEMRARSKSAPTNGPAPKAKLAR